MTVTRHDFVTDVVGESNYFDALAACYFAPEALDCDGGKVIKVNLVREPNNPHDSNAVMVISDYGKIGYLSRDNAKKYQKVIPSHLNATVYCRIWTSDPEEHIYGAWLAINLDNLQNIVFDESAVKPKKKKFLGIF